MTDIKWKQVPRMKPGNRHIHEDTIKDPGAIRYAKGHYVNRPYLSYATSKHECAYTDLYCTLFAPLRNRPITLLELGVYTGESIKFFRDYFLNPNAEIIGFDSHKPEFYGHDWHAARKGIPNTEDAGEPYDGPTHNVFFFLGDQTNKEDLENCGKEYGRFDIVVDDASHYLDLTRNSLKTLWPYLNEGAFYCIEDIGEKDVKPILDEITVRNMGYGVIVKPLGFGPCSGGSSVCLVLVKSKYRMPGLDEVLTEKEPVLDNSDEPDSVV